MALVPGSSSGGLFRRSRAPETATEEVVDRGAAGAFRQIRDQEIQAQMQARAGQSMDPDAAAKARRISAFTGQPAESLIDRLPDFETQARADKAAHLSGQDPVLQWWLADPIRSAASGDDLDTLARANAQYQKLRQGNWFQRSFPGMFMSSTDWSAIQQHQLSEAYAKAAAERRASAAAADGIIARAGAMWSQGVAGLESGLFTVGAALNEWSANNPLPWTSADAIQQNRNAAAELRARAKSTNDTAPIRGATSWEDVKAKRTAGAIGSFVLEQGIGSIPAMIGAAINPVVTATSLSGTIGQQRASNDGREDADIADILKASPYAAASAVLDRFGLGEIIHPIGSTLARRAAWAAAAEGGTEFAQNVIEYGGGTIGTKKAFDYRTAIDQGFAGALAGAGMGGGLHVMGSGVRTAAENGVRIVQARAGERLLGKVFSNAEGSALRNRDPALFAEFLQAHAQGTAAENIFVPAEKLRELYQSNGWDWEDPSDEHFGHFTPDFQEQMQAGLVSGGDVVIPVGKAAAYLAGTPEWEAIKGDARVAPGSFSPNEASTMEEHWAAAMDEMAQAAEASMRADLEASTPRQAVHDAVFSMARQAGFSINAARAYGELWAERYQTRSERLGDGRSAMDLFGDSVAGIRQALPGSLETYRRGDGLDVLVNAMRSGGREMKPEGQSLIDRIVEGGGVEDPGGDIKSMGGDRIVKGGVFGRKRKSLIRERPEGADLLGDMTGNSLTLDDWAMRLWEEGYFPDKMERPSVNDLLDAIGEGLADRHTYPNGGASMAVETNNAIVAAADDLRNMLFSAGLDPDTASRAEIEKAIAAYEAEGDRGYEQGQDQGGARGRIDFLSDNKAMITLFEGRDLSTLLHEGGHLWLEELRSDALAVGEGKLSADWKAVQAWFKREGIEVSDDGDIPTEAHELWARGMERYFMEGKAPSGALQSAFSSFRAWLLRIYKLVTRLNTDIDDSVRRVMDRLIATDNAIAWAIHEADEKALFDSAAAAGMSAQEFNAYRGLLEESRTEAYDQLLYKTMERIRRERTVAYQEERARVRLDVAEEVKARPEFRALDLIRGNGEEYLPLDRRGVIERVGQDAIAALPAGRPGKPTIRDGGADPDLVAERAGFPDGRTMLEALVGVQARHKELVARKDGRSVLDEAIDVATERAMMERHADVFDNGSIEEEALELIHSDAGAQRLAMEVRQLARKVDAVVNGEESPAPLDVVKSWAERVVREGRISDQASAAAVDRHRKAESKAARAAERAYLAGDFATAFREKQKQMMANALYRAARDAKNNVDVMARRLDRLGRSRGYKGMDPEYLDRIHELLENYDLRRRTQAELRERESFDKWAKRQEEAGIEVFIPERLTLAGNVNFTKLKYEDLVALDDAVQSLAHLGREKSRLKLDKEERDFNELVGQAEAQAVALPMRKWSNERNADPSLVRRLDSELTKIEFLADQLDGGNPNGVFNRVLVQQATACANEKERLVRKVIEPLAKLYLDAPKAQQKRWAQRVSVPEFVSINPETKEIVPTTFLRSELIAVALNIGNKSNLEKMLIGETMALPELQRGAHGWTEAKVMSVLNRELTEDDWHFVEAVWKNINELWPDIVRSEREITGVTPEKIEGREVETPFGTIQGGYYPLVYDPTRSQIAADNSADDAAKLLGQMGRSVATPKGHTISRTEAALPITFSLERVLFNHVNRVATRISYGRYVRDALKFIGDSRIRRIVDQHAGLEYHKQLKPWLQRQVNEAAMDTNTLAGLDRMLRQFRVNAQIVWMGFRVTTMISQLAGWNNSAAQIGPKYLLKGMAETARNLGQIRSWVFEQSPEMAGRAQAFDRDVRTFYEDARKAGKREGKTWLDRVAAADHALGLDKARAAAFWGIGMIDVYLVSMPTWVGAYRKAIDEGMTVDEARAYGDKAVRESQGAGRAKDLAAIQDAGEAVRVLTLAYSYFSVQYNKQRETIHAARAGDWRRAAMNIFWIMMAAPVASAFLTGDWPDEEDNDVEGWVAWAMRKMFFGLWAGVPVVRDLAGKWERELSGKFSGDIQAPVYEAFSQIERPIQNAIKLAKGEEPSQRWLRDTITPIGYFVGLPTGQVGTTAQYLHDVATGDQRPAGPGDVAYGLAKGPQKDQE